LKLYWLLAPLCVQQPSSASGQTLEDRQTYNELYDMGMDAISYSTARANLAKTMDRVCEDHTALIITRKGESSVVMLSLADYQALEETAYLLRSPANARRLLQAVDELAGGGGAERSLIDSDRP
jgi:antitoxin YefM